MGKLIEYLKLTNKKADSYNSKIKKSNVEIKFHNNPFKEKGEKTFVWVDK